MNISSEQEILNIFKNNIINENLSNALNTPLINEQINILLLFINDLIKEDKVIENKEALHNMINYLKKLIEDKEDINKKTLDRKLRKIYESISTQLIEKHYKTDAQKKMYYQVYDELSNHLDDINIYNKDKKYLEFIYNVIHDIKNIEYLKKSLDMLNIKNITLKNGNTLLVDLTNIYIEKISNIETELDDVRYYKEVIKILLESDSFNIDSNEKKNCINYLRNEKNKFKKNKNDNVLKNKYLEDIIKIFKESVLNVKTLEGLSDRYNVPISNIPELSYDIPEIDKHLSNRVVSNDYIISIDNSSTREIDDCLSCSKLENGNYLLGIHITDIFGYISINDDIVREAYKRASTIYDKDLFIPMLPFKFATYQASLLENQARYADSHYYEITKDGEIVSDKIMPTIITNNCKIDYDKANNILKTGNTKNKDLLITLNNLNEITNILSCKFMYDDEYISNKEETLDPSLSKVGTSLSERIILYTMLLENSNMAEYFYRNNYPLIYRIHSYQTDIESIVRKRLANATSKYKDDPKIEKLIKEIVKSHPQSLYDIKGGHEGLNLKHYCHSTSPERRFADLWNRYLNKVCRMSRNTDKDIYELENITKDIVNGINIQMENINYFINSYEDNIKKLKK